MNIFVLVDPSNSYNKQKNKTKTTTTKCEKQKFSDNFVVKLAFRKCELPLV